MHFMAMIGFSVPGYPSATTSPSRSRAGSPPSWWSASACSSWASAGQARSRSSRPACSPGVGVAAMHYTGMAAMRVPAPVTYDPNVRRRLRRHRRRRRHGRPVVHGDPAPGRRPRRRRADHGRRRQRHALHRHVRHAGRRSAHRPAGRGLHADHVPRPDRRLRHRGHRRAVRGAAQPVRRRRHGRSDRFGSSCPQAAATGSAAAHDPVVPDPAPARPHHAIRFVQRRKAHPPQRRSAVRRCRF